MLCSYGRHEPIRGGTMGACSGLGSICDLVPEIGGACSSWEENLRLIKVLVGHVLGV